MIAGRPADPEARAAPALRADDDLKRDVLIAINAARRDGQDIVVIALDAGRIARLTAEDFGARFGLWPAGLGEEAEHAGG